MAISQFFDNAGADSQSTGEQQQQQQQQQQQYQFQQQFSQLFYTPSPQPQSQLSQQQQQQQQQLHRPYQPSYDDDMKLTSDVVDDFSMNVDLNFLSTYSLATNDDHLGSRSEGHQLL